MSAQLTKGVTFATGGTYTAGHFNDYVRNATITQVDRTTIDSTLGTFLTRDTLPPPGPTVKEGFIDSTPASLDLEVTRTYTGGIFVAADPGSYLYRFNTGNGPAFEGSALAASISGVVDGIASCGLVAGTATAAQVGIACSPDDTTAGVDYVIAKLFGMAKVRVKFVCDVGNLLGPSSTPGVLQSSTTFNQEREDGSTSPQCIAMALEASSDPGVKLILAKIYR